MRYAINGRPYYSRVQLAIASICHLNSGDSTWLKCFFSEDDLVHVLFSTKDAGMPMESRLNTISAFIINMLHTKEISDPQPVLVNIYKVL